jgi:hypothetical protein
MEIAMDAQFKDSIRHGEKNKTVRRGVRDYEPGTCLVRYTDGDTDFVHVTEITNGKVRDLDEDYFQSMRQFYPDLAKDEDTTTVWFELAS